MTSLSPIRLSSLIFADTLATDEEKSLNVKGYLNQAQVSPQDTQGRAGHESQAARVISRVLGLTNLSLLLMMLSSILPAVNCACSNPLPTLVNATEQTLIFNTEGTVPITYDVSQFFKDWDNNNCGRDQYILSATGDMTYTTHPKISLAANILTVQVNTKLSVNLYITGFYDFLTVYRSQPIKVVVDSVCYGIDRTVLGTPPLTWYIQVNKELTPGYFLNEIKTPGELEGLWTAPVNSLCTLADWQILRADNDQLITSSDTALYSFLNYASKTTMQPLTVNTQSTNYNEQTFEFKIQAILRATTGLKTFVNPTKAQVKVIMGCIDEQLGKTFTKDATLNHINFGSLDVSKGELLMVFPKITDGNEVTEQFHLNEVISLEGDIKKCGPTEIRAYLDQTRKTQTNFLSKSSILSNPTTRDVTTRTIDPIVSIRYGDSMIEPPLTIYLQAKGDAITGKDQVIKNLVLWFELCNDQPLRQTKVPYVLTPLIQGRKKGQFNLDSVFNISYKYPRACAGTLYTLTQVDSFVGTYPLSITGNFLTIDLIHQYSFQFKVTVKMTKSSAEQTWMFEQQIKSACFSEAMMPTQTVFRFQAQMNKLNDKGDYTKTLIKEIDLPNMFTTPNDLKCVITKFFITAASSDKRLPETDPIAQRFLMQSDNNTQLVIDTRTYEQRIQVFKLRMYVVLEGNDLIVNPKWADVEVELNCNEENFTKLWTKKEENDMVESINQTNTHVIVPRTPEKANYQLSVDRLFTLEPIFFGCFPGFGQASPFQNMSINVTESDQVRLQEIPTFQKEDGRLHPVVVIETGPSITTLPDIHFKASKLDGYNLYSGSSSSLIGLSSQMQFTFEVCNDSPKGILDPQNISLSQGATPSTYQLSSMFQFSYKYPKSCSGETYFLSLKPDRRSPLPTTSHSISSDGLLLLNTNVTSQLMFYVVLKLSKSQTKAAVQFNVTVINNKPIWQEDLKLDHLVTISYDQEGNVIGEKFYVYQSPQLVDLDSAVQTLVLNIGSFSKAEFITVLKPLDNKFFKLTVDKEMVAKPGVFTTTISYGDQFSRTLERAQLTVTIETVYPRNETAEILKQQLEQKRQNELNAQNQSKAEDPDDAYYYYDEAAIPQNSSEQDQVVSAYQAIADSKVKHDLQEQAIKIKQFQALGFKRYDGLGLVFPEVEEAKVKSAKNLKAKDLKPPTLRISHVSQLGEFKLVFDQEMLLPSSISDQILSSIFQFELISELDNSLRIGKVRNYTEEETVRELASQDPIDDHEFFVSFRSSTPKEIGFKVHFTNMDSISKGNSKDTFRVKVLEPQLFKSANSGMALPLQTNEVLEKGVPPIIDDETAKAFDDATQLLGTITLVILIFNFLVCQFLGTTSQPMWGLVRTLQYFVFCSLVNIPSQAFAFRFYQGLSEFTQFDIVFGHQIFEIIPFKMTKPWNDNFEHMDFKSANFLLNSNSYFVIMAVIIILNSLCSITNCLAVVCSRRLFCRKIGMSVYSDSRLDDIASQISKLVLESYFDLSIITILSLCSFLEVDAAGESVFGHFWLTNQDIICSIIALIHLGLLVAYPLWCFVKVTKNFNKFNMKTVRENCRVQIQDNNYETPRNANYQFYFMLRRLATTAILIFLPHVPFFQCASLIGVNTLNFGFVVASEPMTNKFLNRLLTFNELCIALFFYMITNLQNINFPDELKTVFSWIMIASLGLVLLVNLPYLATSPFLQICRHYKTVMVRKKIQQAIKINYTNRQYLKQHYGLELKYFEQHRLQLMAVSKCQEWGQQRRWLMKNRLNPERFKEEAEFQELTKQIGLIEKARVQKFEKALKYSIKKHTVEVIEEHRTKLMQKYQELDDIRTKAKFEQNNNQGNLVEFIKKQRELEMQLDKIAANKYKQTGLEDLSLSQSDEQIQDGLQQFDSQVKPVVEENKPVSHFKSVVISQLDHHKVFQTVNAPRHSVNVLSSLQKHKQMGILEVEQRQSFYLHDFSAQPQLKTSCKQFKRQKGLFLHNFRIQIPTNNKDQISFPSNFQLIQAPKMEKQEEEKRKKSIFGPSQARKTLSPGNEDLASLMSGARKSRVESEVTKSSLNSQKDSNNNQNYNQQYYNSIPEPLKKKIATSSPGSQFNLNLSRHPRMPEIIEEPENEERETTYRKGNKPKHTLKDVDLNPVQKHEIFKKVNQEAFQNPLLAQYDGSKLDYFNTDALKQIEELIGIMTFSKDTKQQQEIYKIVQSELSLLNKHQMNYEQIVLYEELMAKEQELKRTLNPLGNEDSSSEDYGEEVYTKLFNYEKEQLFQDFKKVTPLKVMTQAGENDFLQAVLQPLMDMPIFAEYMILQMYKNEPKKKEKQVYCEMLNDLFEIMFQEEFDVLGENHEISIDFILHKIRRRFKPTQKHDAFVFFEHLINKITSEIGFDHENADNLIFKSLMLGSEITETCENNHVVTRIALSPFHSMKFKQPINDYLNLVFSPSEQKRKCREKKCKSNLLQTSQEVRFMPEVLIFVYPMEDLLADDDLQEPPMEIDLAPFLSFVASIEKNETVFELTSIVCFQGSKMEETEYSVYVRRTIKKGKDHGKQFWLRYSQDFREACDIEDALREPNKTMIFYSRRVKE